MRTERQLERVAGFFGGRVSEVFVAGLEAAGVGARLVAMVSEQLAKRDCLGAD